MNAWVSVLVNSKRHFSILLVTLFLASCSIISAFDELTLNESYRIKKDIAILYQLLQDTPDEQRQYHSFQRDYADIIVSLNELLDRQKLRENNQETTKIVEQILDFMTKYRDAHKSQDSYKDAKIKLHSKRMDSLMRALTVAEEAKRR